MTISDYRQLCQKNEAENYFFDKYIFRKVSIYFTIIFIKLRLTANQATFLSLLASLSSCYFLMQNTTAAMFLGPALIFTYYMLDHVDGELARYYIRQGKQQPSLQGTYFDVLIHKYSTNLMLFFLGVSVYNFFNYRWAVLLGFAACIGMSAFPNLLASQVIVQKIAQQKELVDNPAVVEVLNLLEKKQEQIKKVTSTNPLKRLKKIITELLFFPGALLMIMLVTLADLIVPTFTLFNYPVNIRLLFLLAVTPIYLTNALRQTLKWFSKFAEIA
ncbi:MAG TPA: CDP-alcohol phosphatidyltransferase family protein [Oscillospiraceae bacterium]|nr:CDP-alcohol phosphatidyltransferase family protein [Oscillospiraceae bacterium]